MHTPISFGFEPGLKVRMATTAILLGGLYVLVIALAIAVGTGVVAASAIAATLFLVQYFTCDRLALAALRADVVTARENPGLYAMVSGLCARAELPMARIAVIQSPMPNAFTVGRSPTSATVCVTTGLQALLGETELEAVLAHELTHIVQRDVMFVTLGSFFASIGAFIATRGESLLPRRLRRGTVEEPPFFLVAILAGLVHVVSYVLVQALSRHRELVADRGAAQITGRPSALSSALVTIAGRLEQLPASDLPVAAGELAALAILVPDVPASLASIFATHPSLETRLTALGRLEPRPRLTTRRRRIRMPRILGG